MIGPESFADALDVLMRLKHRDAALAAAFAHGQMEATFQKPVQTCPWSNFEKDSSQAELQREWVRGWLHVSNQNNKPDRQSSVTDKV